MILHIGNIKRFFRLCKIRWSQPFCFVNRPHFFCSDINCKNCPGFYPEVRYVQRILVFGKRDAIVIY